MSVVSESLMLTGNPFQTVGTT